MRITSLCLNAGYMNMSTPDAVAWTQRSLGAAASNRSGSTPRMTSVSAACGTASFTPLTNSTTEPSPAASRIDCISASVTDGRVSPVITRTFI